MKNLWNGAIRKLKQLLSGCLKSEQELINENRRIVCLHFPDGRSKQYEAKYSQCGLVVTRWYECGKYLIILRFDGSVVDMRSDYYTTPIVLGWKPLAGFTDDELDIMAGHGVIIFPSIPPTPLTPFDNSDYYFRNPIKEQND